MAARKMFLNILLTSFFAEGALAGVIGCGNIQFQSNTIDTFSYRGVVENGINGTTHNVTKLKITATVEISNANNCDFIMKLSEVNFHESIGKDDAYKSLARNDFVDRLEKYHLKFEMKNGIVNKITPSVKSIQSDVLNMQRGVLSTLQVRSVSETHPEKLIVEDDISGSCETAYVSIKRTEKHDVIEKVKDLNTCVDHHRIRSTIDGDSYSEDDETHKKKDSVYDSQNKCIYKLKLDGGGLDRVNCKERFLARAFSSNGEAGAYVTTSSKLKRLSSSALSQLSSPYNDFYTTFIKFDHELPVDKTSNSLEYQQKAKTLLLDLAKEEYYVSKYDSAQRFFALVVSFRHLKLNDVKTIVGTVNLKNEQIRTFLFDAMVQCGTSACLQVLFQTMDQAGMQKEATRVLPYLAFIKDPSPEVIGLLLGLHQKTQHPSLLLLITTLSYRMCRNHQQVCNTGRVGQTMKDTENYLLSLLGKDCQTSDLRKQHKIFFALKGIGNLGRPSKAMPLIMDCVRNAKHANMSTAALQAIRKMQLSKDTRYTLLEILADQNNELEKRLEVFMLLMQNPSREEIVLARDVANDGEDVTQLRSFINSYLRSAMKNKTPASKGKSQLIRDVLNENPLDDFDPSSSRYSKAFLHSANFMQFAATVNGMTFFHPESFVPRAVNLNITTHLFGFSVNALEINARMEGLERLIGKYLSNDGYLSASYLQKAFKIPKRFRRGVSEEEDEYEKIDNTVNMKASTPQALVSFKMFGNEIQVLTLDDLPFLNGKLDDVNIIHDLYELTKGKRKVLKHNMVVMEVSHSVPTLLGMPMKIDLNGSAVVTVDMNGKVDTKNLIFGPKTVTLSGSLKPSVSLHASGKLSVQCYGVNEIGTSFLGNVHLGKDFHGKIHYEEGKEVISELKADEKVTDLFNVSYNIFHESTLKKEEIKGIEKRAKGYLCTKDLFDTSLIGSDVCIQASFPNAFYNSSAPFFPLTGPFDFGIRNYPRDLLLTKYVLHVQKLDDMYTVSIGTPGASSERKYSLNIGLARKEEGGLIGLTVGELKRGIVFDYVFDQDTNDVQATLTSNFTKSPIILYGEFSNQTDPMTLNRHVGVKWSFTYDKIFIQHDLFYKNTYQYWSLGSRVEYAKDRFAKLDLKIQYEPQQFDLIIEHKPTNTKIFAKAIPALPKIESQLNITHGKDVKLNSYAMIDISKYEVVGDLKVYPEKLFLNAKGKIEPEDKRLWLKADMNGKPYSIDSKLYEDGKVKTLSSSFGFSMMKAVHMLKWDSESMNTTLSSGDEINMYWKNLMTRTSVDTLLMKFLISWKKGDEMVLENVYKNSSKLHELCSITIMPTVGKSGTCYTFHHSKDKQGVVVKYFQKGKWDTPLSLLRENLPSGSTFNIKVMKYVSMMYTRNDEDVTMKLHLPYFTAEVPQMNKDNFHAKITVSNGTVNSIGKLQLSRRYSGKLTHFSAIGESSHSNTILGRITFNSTLTGKNPVIFETPFVNVLAVNVKDNKALFKVAIKDHSSPSPNFNNEDYTLINMKGWRVIGYESNLKNRFQYQLVEERSSNDISYSFKFATFNPWKNTLSPMEALSSLVIKSNGKMQIVMHDTQISKQYSAIGQGMIMQYIGKYGNQVFGILGLDKTLTSKLTRAMQTAMISYFSTTKCNGAEIHKRFINNEFDKKDVVDVMMAILKFPTSKQFQQITKLDMTDEKQIAGKLVSALKKNENKNVLQMVGGIIGDLSGMKDEAVDLKYLVKLKDMFQNDKSFNVFEKEFFSLTQQLVNQVQHLVKNEKTLNIEKLDMTMLDRFIPEDVRKKVGSTLKKCLQVLKTWKFDVLKTPQENIKTFIASLEKADAFELLKLNHIDIITRSIIERSNLPKDIEDVLKAFLRNLDHVTLVRKISKFALQSFEVPAPHKNPIDKLMTSKNLDEYFNTLANVIHKKGRLSNDQKKSFKTFLDTQNRMVLFKQFKDTLKEKYRVKDTGIDLLETIIADGDLRSFKNLPTLYSVNFFPKLAKKVLVNLKNLNLAELLKQFTVFIKDADLKQALESIMESKQDLNQLPTILLKMLMKKSEGLNLDATEKKVLQEFNELSMKFMAIALGKEKNQGKIIKSLILEYYGSIYGALEKVLPDPLKPIMKKMSTQVFNVLRNIKATDLEKDATVALFKASKKLSVAVVNFVDKNFENFVKDDLVRSIKPVMQRINFGRQNLWDLKEIYMKKTSEQLSFLIRLLGQFSSTEENYFAKQFIKNGKILYYKIYQSIWKSQVSNPNNLKQMAALFKGLEKKALQQIMEITGDYSLKVTVDKTVLFVKGLVEGESFESIVSNFKDKSTSVFSNISSVFVDQFNRNQSVASIFNKVFYIGKGLASGRNWLSVFAGLNDNVRHKMSYDTVLTQAEELLIILGHVKQNSLTINQVVKKALPNLVKGVSKMYQDIVKFNKYDVIRPMKKAKEDIAEAFTKFEKQMDQAINKENSFVKMIVELLAPSVNGIRPLIARTLSYDAIAEAETLARMKKVCKDGQFNLYCEVLYFYDNIKVIGKDETILDTLLNGVEQMVLKMLDEQIRKTKSDEKRLKGILEGITKLSTKKLENPLQEFVFSIIDLAQNYIITDEEYQKAMKMFNPIDMSLRNAINQYVAAPLNNITWQLSDKTIHTSASKYIPIAVKTVSSAFHNASRQILFGIDKFKSPLAKSAFVSDPMGFVLSLPKTILADINKNMAKYKQLTLKSFKEFESKVKQLHKKVLKELGQYSGKLDEISGKLLKSYKAEMSKHLDPVIKSLEDVNRKMEKELEGYMILSGGKEHFKKKLSGFTKKAKGLRQKYRKIQQQYIDTLKKQINKMLDKKDLMAPFNKKNIMQEIFGNIDRKLLATVLKSLDQDLEGIVSNTVYPQLQVLVKSIDETVCNIKKNISKFYEKNDKGQVISWKMPGFYQQYQGVENKIDGMMIKFKEGHTRIMQENAQVFNFNVIQSKLSLVFDVLPQKGFTKVKQGLTQYMAMVSKGRMTYLYFGSKSADQIIKIVSGKYQLQLKRVAALANKALQFTPPNDLETPVFKFLGLRNEQEKSLFEPISRTAYLFEKSLVTFDGKAIYLPKDITGEYKGCKYLLTRDFQWKNFTVYLHEGKFVVEMKDGKVVVDRRNTNKVEVFMRLPPSFSQVKRLTDFPVQLAFSSVLMPQSNVLEIKSLLGLVVYCRLDSFMCNITVSGYYHNKTLGLFGTNNVENSDDLRMPNGEVALDLVEFVNAYELRQTEKCFIDDPSKIVDEESGEDEEDEKCSVFKNHSKQIKLVDFETRSSAFKDVCRNEQHLSNIHEAYISSVTKEFGPISAKIQPTLPGDCSRMKGTLRYSNSKQHNNLHLTILIKLTPNMVKTRPHIKRILTQVQKEIGAKSSVQYCIVGYGGDGIRAFPHVQTGNGKVFTNLDEALKAIDLLSFSGENIEDRLGLRALKFASQLDFKSGSKIFVLLDDDPSYTHSLREMIDVSGQLISRGIILNTVNAYQMRRDVIGKDSYGKRYHVREPLGQHFQQLSFPPPDDYIPLVKQSRGAVFTLKAFVSSKAKWGKALPLSLTKVLALQTKTDQRQCKECSCEKCKDILNDICDLGL